MVPFRRLNPDGHVPEARKIFSCPFQAFHHFVQLTCVTVFFLPRTSVRGRLSRHCLCWALCAHPMVFSRDLFFFFRSCHPEEGAQQAATSGVGLDGCRRLGKGVTLSHLFTSHCHKSNFWCFALQRHRTITRTILVFFFSCLQQQMGG